MIRMYFLDPWEKETLSLRKEIKGREKRENKKKKERREGEERNKSRDVVT